MSYSKFIMPKKEDIFTKVSVAKQKDDADMYNPIMQKVSDLPIAVAQNTHFVLFKRAQVSAKITKEFIWATRMQLKRVESNEQHLAHSA
jgi:hypothetical protein